MAQQIAEYLVMVGVTFIIQWTVFTALSVWTPLAGGLAAAAANAAQMIVTFVILQQRIFTGVHSRSPSRGLTAGCGLLVSHRAGPELRAPSGGGV